MTWVLLLGLLIGGASAGGGLLLHRRRTRLPAPGPRGGAGSTALFTLDPAVRALRRCDGRHDSGVPVDPRVWADLCARLAATEAADRDQAPPPGAGPTPM